MNILKTNYLYLKIVWSGFFAISELKTGYNLFKFQNLELSLIKIKVFISYSYTKSINKIDLMIKNFDYNLIKKNIFCKRKKSYYLYYIRAPSSGQTSSRKPIHGHSWTQTRVRLLWWVNQDLWHGVHCRLYRRQEPPSGSTSPSCYRTPEICKE